MKRMFNKVVEKLRGVKGKLAAALAVTVAAVSSATIACATEGTSPSLDIAFDVAECFSWAQTIISAMLPVVYITMGVSLGFLIIRAFKSAFNG